MLQRFLSLFARYPWLSFITIIVISIISLIGYYDPQLITGRASNDDEVGLAVESRQDRDASRASAQRRAANAGRARLFAADVTMVVTADDFFNPMATEAIRTVVRDLKALPQVTDIMWLDTAPPLNIFGMQQPALPDQRSSPERFAAAKREALANPLVGGQLLSRDGKTLLLLISIDWFHVRRNDECTRDLEKVSQKAMANFSDVKFSFAVTGELPIQLLIKRNTLQNDRKFQWMAYATTLILATIIFRGPTAVIITALAPVLGIFWTLGCLRFFELQDNPFNTVVVPVLLSLVGFTDGVHMMTQIRKYRAAGMSGYEASCKSMQEVGLACFLTSLTTAIGFGSLGWAHHELVREFGWCCVLGVGLTFIAVITAIPIACSSWLGRSVHHGIHRGMIESNVGRLSNLMLSVLRYPRLFAWGGIAITFVCVAMALQMRPDERVWSVIPEKSLEAKALRHMDRVFGGLESANVTISWDERVPDGDPEIIQVNAEVEKVLHSESMLGSPIGIATLLRALPGESDPVAKNSMRDLLPSPLKRAFLREEDREASVVFRVQDIGIRGYDAVFGRVTQQLERLQQEHPRFSLKLDGAAIWRWKNLYQIILDLIASLSSAMVIIAITLGVAYRSFRLGCIAIIPNLFPLAVTGAGMYWLGMSLELVSVLAFTICLGIAVDDTIHFMTRYTEELKKNPDNQRAIYESFMGVGGACIMTTIVLVCGFATVMASDTRDHFLFAMMGGCTIAFALLGDMLILPAMLLIFPPRPPSR